MKHEVSMDHISQSTGYYQREANKRPQSPPAYQEDPYTMSSEKKSKKKTTKKRDKIQTTAPKLPLVCSDFQCKSKLAVQGELIEKVVKDKDRVQTELNQLKNDLELEINMMYRAVLGAEEADKDGAQKSWKQKIDQVKLQFEKLIAAQKTNPQQPISNSAAVMQKHELMLDVQQSLQQDSVLGKDSTTISLKELYNDYFQLRETNIDAKNDVFIQTFTQARNIDLERRKLQAEIDVLRLKDANNTQTMQDLEGMFALDLSQQAIYNQLTTLNEKFHQQNLDLNKQIAQLQAKVNYH